MRGYITKLGVLGVTAGLNALAAFSLQVLLAHLTTPRTYGEYSAIIATIGVAAPLCGFGIPQYWLRLWGEYNLRAVPLLKYTLRYIARTTGVILIGLCVWFSFYSNSLAFFVAAVLLSSNVFSRVGVDLLTSSFQIEYRYYQVALWQLNQNVLFLGLLVLFSFISSSEADLISVAAIQSIANVLLLIPIAQLINSFFLRNERRYLNSQEKTVLLPNLRILIKESAPFGASTLFYVIYYQLSVVFVRFATTATETANYNVALLILTGTFLIPTVFYQKFLIPKFHEWAYSDALKLKRAYSIGLFGMFACGVCVAAVIFAFAPSIIRLIFGERYDDAVPLLRTLIINVPIVYAADGVGSLLVTQSNVLYRALHMGVAACLSVFLLPILLPRLGAAGGAYAIICCNVYLLIAYAITAYDKVVKMR